MTHHSFVEFEIHPDFVDSMIMLSNVKLKMVAMMFFFCHLLTVLNATNTEADFSKVIKSKFFVDKTLMIRDFMNYTPEDPYVRLITAPPKSGKSTIIDMLKRFLSIPVDSDGKRVPLESSENYKLFCQPKLKICENETFVKEHMGKYPVIHIDYLPLQNVKDFYGVFPLLGYAVKASYEQHKYLALNASLYVHKPKHRRRKYFIKHFEDPDSLYELDLTHSFHYLSDLLWEHFDKDVIVLFDNYNSYFTELAQIEDGDEICQFLEGVNKPLFRYNPDLEKALMTGILHLRGEGQKWEKEDLVEYHWLGDHEFSKYYGLTKEDVLQFIHMLTKDDTNINKIENIFDYYYGYQIQNQDRIFNLKSVIEFFQKNMKLKQNLIKSDELNWLVRVIKRHENIFDEMKDLISTKATFYANFSEPLSVSDIMTFKLKENGTINKERFLMVMFELGYLSPVHRNSSGKYVPVKIANSEKYVEFSKVLKQIYAYNYQLKLDCVQNIHESIDTFAPGKNNTQLFDMFVQNFHRLLHDCATKNMTMDDFQTFFFVILSSVFPIANYTKQTAVHNVKISLPSLLKDTQSLLAKSDGNKTNTETERIDLVFANKHEMLIIIETKLSNKTNIERLAKAGLCQALLGYETYLENNPVQFLNSRVTLQPTGVIYVGLAYDLGSRSVHTAFYYPAFHKEPIYISARGDVNEVVT